MKENKPRKRAGIIRRDLIRLLAELGTDKYEAKQTGTQLLTLMFGVCCLAHIDNVRRDKLIDLFVDIVKGFDVDEMFGEEP